MLPRKEMIPLRNLKIKYGKIVIAFRLLPTAKVKINIPPLSNSVMCGYGKMEK